MSKISIDELKTALQASDIEPEKQQKVLEELQQIIEDNKSHNPPAPKLKNEFGVVLFDANHELIGKEFTACVYTVKEGTDHGLVMPKIFEAVKAQNESAKKKKNIIKSVGEAFAHLKRAFIKPSGIMLKTKEPVRVLISDNSIL